MNFLDEERSRSLDRSRHCNQSVEQSSVGRPRCAKLLRSGRKKTNTYAVLERPPLSRPRRRLSSSVRDYRASPSSSASRPRGRPRGTLASAGANKIPLSVSGKRHSPALSAFAFPLFLTSHLPYPLAFSTLFLPVPSRKSRGGSMMRRRPL